MADVGIEPGTLVWELNAQPLRLLATRYLVVHKAIAIYYKSSEILLI